MMWDPKKGFPRSCGRLVGAGEPDNLLYKQASTRFSFRRVRLASWGRGGGGRRAHDWLEEMTRLIDRLHPEVEFEPWDQDHIEAKVGAHLTDEVGTCAFCNQPIAREELWGISIYDAYNMNSIGQGRWLHLPCLNARLHHKHAIADMKFDPDNMPDLDKL